MAIYDASFTLVDAWGRNTNRSFKVEAVDIPTAETALAAFATDYQGVTELQLTESRLTVVSTYAGAPAAGANVDEGATFSCQLATPNKVASTKVPGIIQAARLAGGVISLVNAAVVLYMAHFTSGFVKLSDGEDVASFIKGTLDK